MKPWRSVFAIVPDCHASTGHYAPLWQRHFYDGLRQAVSVFEIPADISFDWAFSQNEDIAPSRNRAAEKLRHQIREFRNRERLDVVISYARSAAINPDLVRETVADGIPWINFFCDSVSQFGEVEELASVVSLNWFPESSAIEKYRALGRPALCRPYAFNFEAIPAIDLSTTTVEKVGFVGVPSTNRITILSILSLLGCPLEIHGYGWDTKSSASNAPKSWQGTLQRAIFQPGSRRIPNHPRTQRHPHPVGQNRKLHEISGPRNASQRLLLPHSAQSRHLVRA
jgi:hypothetical protein